MKKIKLDLVDSNREYLIEILQLFKINFFKSNYYNFHM